MRKIIFIILLLLSVLTLFADEKKGGPFRVPEITFERIGNKLQIKFTLDYSKLIVNTNEQYILQPVIISSSDTLRLPYILFPGQKRYKINQRKQTLYGKDKHTKECYANVYLSGYTFNLHYRQAVPFEKWMYNARLVFYQDIYGCADCHTVLATIPVKTIPGPPRPSLIVPEPNNKREEFATLYIDFQWDQARIIPTFRNNASELKKIDASMDKVLHDRPGTLQLITLTGYASPEGGFSYNSRLAGRRIQAIKKYIGEHFPVEEKHFIVDTIPEDWEGVRKWVDSLNIAYKEDIIHIIDSVKNPDQRDYNIIELDEGIVYKKLIEEIYPRLRRTEYKINYEVDTFNIEQCIEMYRTHPESLSIYELYCVATCYPLFSEEFNRIITQTASLYPSDTVALNNACAVAISQGNIDKANQYLEPIKRVQQVQNNLGVIYFEKGYSVDAKMCFEKAGKNDRTAFFNLNTWFR